MKILTIGSQHCLEIIRKILPPLLLQPGITEDELIRAIEERLNQGECAAVNFSKADSLSNRKEDIYEIYSNPSESAYDKFSELRDKLNLDYGNNTTAKGKALEELILYIFILPCII